MTVVVVIADGHSHVVSGAGQAGGVGHIGENAVAIVAEKTIAELGRIFFQCRNVGAIGKENVGAPIAVVVEDGNTAQHRLGHVFCRSDAILQLEWDLPELKFDGSVCRRMRLNVIKRKNRNRTQEQQQP